MTQPTRRRESDHTPDTEEIALLSRRRVVTQREKRETIRTHNRRPMTLTGFGGLFRRDITVSTMKRLRRAYRRQPMDLFSDSGLRNEDHSCGSER
jgi:hypothetical protein